MFPTQAGPIHRGMVGGGHAPDEVGVEPSECTCNRMAGEGVEPAQTICDGMTGAARQMCYNLVYGIPSF
jgi:hypothetical protein